MSLTDHHIATLRAQYRAGGYSLLREFLPSSECTTILEKVETHPERLISVEIDSIIARNKFFTINGEELEGLIPRITTLSEELCAIVSELEGRQLAPLDNKTVGLSLNLTPPGGVLSWHYDRNLVTAVIHLNAVTGGEFEVYPRYRVRLRDNHHGARRVVQRVFDAAMRPETVRRAFGRKVTVKPHVGGAVFMDSTCLHQVAPVTGTTSRGAIVFCFDEPGKTFGRDRTKNYYGYRDRKANVYG